MFASELTLVLPNVVVFVLSTITPFANFTPNVNELSVSKLNDFGTLLFCKKVFAVTILLSAAATEATKVFATVVLLFNESVISLKVSNCDGAPPIKSVNSVCTYSVVASLVLLSFADAVTPVAAAPALKVAPVKSVVPV